MRFDGTADYVATDDLKIAVNAAIALERPLLVKGEPGTGKTLLVRGTALPQDPAGGYVLVFDDISQLIQAQRATAWAEVARRLAHEIKNPLTPIQLSAERLETIDRIVRRGITGGGYPGAAVVVGRRGFAVFEKGYGRLGWTASSAPVVPDESIYDLASLTKVVGTATAAMILWDEGRLDLDAPVARYLPAFSGGAKDQVTIRHLLTHT